MHDEPQDLTGDGLATRSITNCALLIFGDRHLERILREFVDATGHLRRIDGGLQPPAAESVVLTSGL